VRNLIGAAISNKLSRAILLTSGTFTKAALDTAKMVDPLSIQLIDLPALRKWVAEIEANYDETEIVRIIRTFTQRLIEAIGKNEDLLKEIEWRDMERIVAEIFDGLGFKVELTPLSKDGGRDVILECIVEGRSSSFIVEIKHWRTGQRVGQRLIKDFVQVIMTEKREGGLFLSTFGYADNVVESLTEVERGAVRLGDRDKLVALTQTYLKRKSGTWQSEHSLPQILFKDTI
jgi:restriction endonuclease Mrr